jgi:3-hydroxyisobutyrate dehydrogenase-like beta-hydroxyacid dehydrogenase
VTRNLLPHLQPGALHISCSTVSPFTSRGLARLHAKRQVGFVGAPVFARPDGVARRQAYFSAGATDAVAIEQARYVVPSRQSYVVC